MMPSCCAGGDSQYAVFENCTGFIMLRIVQERMHPLEETVGSFNTGSSFYPFPHAPDVLLP
jgi:hypothetical protein